MKLDDALDQFLQQTASRFPTSLITLSEAAEIARADLQTVYAWSSEGRLDEFKMKPGRRCLLLRDQFVRWLFEQKSRSTR